MLNPPSNIDVNAAMELHLTPDGDNSTLEKQITLGALSINRCEQ